MNLDRQDIRKLIYYCWKRGLSNPEIENEINETLRKDIVSKRTCERWVSKFIGGDFGIQDMPHTGRPSFDIDEAIQNALDNDKFATTRSIGIEINISHETVWRHLLDMGKKNLANRWLPHHLTNENKVRRKLICQDLLRMYTKNNFLMQLITMDEMWLYWDNECAHRRSWRGKGDVPVAIPKVNITNRKNMFLVFWDAKGVLLMDILPSNVTVTADYYCKQLDKLVVALKEKRRRTCLKNMYYLHDNAKPHTAGMTVAKLHEIGFHVLPHPPYSPDLSPSDFYLFSAMKSAIRGKNYTNSADISTELNKWISSKDTAFFSKGIKEELPHRWQKCIDHDGDYFEHLNDIDV